MVAVVAMVSQEGVLDGDGKTGSGVMRPITDTGSVACLVRRGNWWVGVGPIGRGMLSVVEDDG
jgi:hypothetical protein